LESKEDNDKDSKEITDWGMIFMLLKNRGFSHEEILNLSYPQFNAYMNNVNNPLTYKITIPYMGSGGEEKKEEIGSKEELINIIADMNKDFL
jgi:endonuclease IV